MFTKHSRARDGAALTQAREKWPQQLAAGEQMPQEEEQSERQCCGPEREAGATPAPLETRLRAYYGPALPEHRLPESSWAEMHVQLAAYARSGTHPRRAFSPFQARLGQRDAVPQELQQIYTALLLQVPARRQPPRLSCRAQRRASLPRVAPRLWGRGEIRLLLPRGDWAALQRAELDLLLATGLARCTSLARLLTLVLRTLFAASLLVLLAALPLTSVDRRALWISLVAMSCSLLSGQLLTWQQRVQIFRADQLAAQWLGFEQASLGLVQLAERARIVRRWPLSVDPTPAARITHLRAGRRAQKAQDLTLVG